MRANRRRPPVRSGWRSLHTPLRPRPDQGRGRRWLPRRYASIDERARQRVPRAASAVLAVAELAALVTLLAGPAAVIRHVDVSGNHRLSAAQVVAAAGLRRPGSVFMVDPAATERRLAGSTWVRSASVGPQLPDRVGIEVEEWQPVATFRAGAGPVYDVSDQAVALGLAGPDDAASLLAIVGPARPQPRPGRQALDLRLLVALVNVQRALPGLIGQEARSFAIDGCGNLTLTVKRGWDVQFGRALTPEELASLKDKLAALRSLAAAGSVDYGSPDLQYVNVMSPTAPAVRVRPARPPSPAPSPPARPGPAPCA